MGKPFFEERWSLVSDRDGDDEYVLREYIIRNATKHGSDLVRNTEGIEVSNFLAGDHYERAKVGLKEILEARNAPRT
jgi:hypothetical protein